MEIHFDKYQGAGNDFILLDNREGNYTNLTMEQRKSLCNRNMGIGADGLILIVNSTEADFEMRYFNSDGNLSTLCGNGGRCAVAFAHHKKMIGEDKDHGRPADILADLMHYCKSYPDIEDNNIFHDFEYELDIARGYFEEEEKA